MFSPEVSEQLKYYVYRLIDPRNGETFYVGKGRDNRVFAHVNDELRTDDEDAATAKLRRIRQVRLAGFEVGHVIHRHGLDEAAAFEVEAALIDAYPAATNIAGGLNSDSRGPMHSKEIIERYEAKPAVFSHSAVLITINRSAMDRTTYEAVRYAWKIDPQKARRCELVLAVQQGLIIEAFVADEWLEATTANFPGTNEDRPGRWGFVGHLAPESIAAEYRRRRVPDRKRGQANPVRYVPKGGFVPIS
ncbi:MAG: hypothetical protein IT299_13145 [Dehalococcoidia bacterium]|nr:hypothetical protein [Dehalococcoidia bacterium]